MIFVVDATSPDEPRENGKRDGLPCADDKTVAPSDNMLSVVAPSDTDGADDNARDNTAGKHGPEIVRPIRPSVSTVYHHTVCVDRVYQEKKRFENGTVERPPRYFVCYVWFL